VLLWIVACQDPDARLRADVLALPPTDVAGARERILAMDDPIDRGVTVELWIRQNRDKVNAGEASQLCKLVAAPEYETCVRHLHALHLSR
jgi:hypothetical protein